MNAESQPHYRQPGTSTRIFNSAVASLTKMGVSVYGSRVLAVRGRKSGEWRTTPVNPLTFEGVGPDSPDDKLLAIAPDHPVFRIK